MKNPLRLALIAVSAAALTGVNACAPKPVVAPVAVAVAAASEAIARPFDLALTLTPAAAEKLKAMGESVALSAYYYGDARIDAAEHANEVDLIDLGDELIDVAPVNGITRFKGEGIDPAKFVWIEGGKPSVLINVYTARKVAPDNLVSCGIFQDLIDVAQKEPIKIDCDLIAPGDVGAVLGKPPTE